MQTVEYSTVFMTKESGSLMWWVTKDERTLVFKMWCEEQEEDQRFLVGLGCCQARQENVMLASAAENCRRTIIEIDNGYLSYSNLTCGMQREGQHGTVRLVALACLTRKFDSRRRCLSNFNVTWQDRTVETLGDSTVTTSTPFLNFWIV